MHPRLARLAVLAAAVAVVAGCSGGSDPSSPTADGEAQAQCQSVSTELQQIGDDLASVPDKIPGDLPGAQASVESAVARVGALTDRVTDPELRTKVSALTDALATLQQQLADAGNDPVGSVSGLLSAVADARTAYTDLKGYCGIS